MELLFKWFYHPFFLVSNHSSDDDDLLTCLVVFWRNSFCAMSQNLTKFLLFNGMQNAQCVANFQNSMNNGINFQMILSFFLFSVKLEFRHVVLLSCLVLFWRNPFCAMSKILRKILILNDMENAQCVVNFHNLMNNGST